MYIVKEILIALVFLTVYCLITRCVYRELSAGTKRKLV